MPKKPRAKAGFTPKGSEATGKPLVATEESAGSLLSKKARLERYKRGLVAALEENDSEQEDRAESSRSEFILFTLGGRQFAVEAEIVVEVIEAQASSRLPNAPDLIEGIISVRGTILPLIRVSERLDCAPPTQGPEARIIVVKDAEGYAGFTVDRVVRVQDVNPQDIERRVPEIETATNYSLGLVHSGSTVCVLLDTRTLLRLHEAVALGEVSGGIEPSKAGAAPPQ